MSVTDYQSVLYNIPEERQSHSHHNGSLKSHMFMLCFEPLNWSIFSM